MTTNKKKNKGSKKNKPTATTTPSLPELISQAETAMITDPTIAIAIYEKCQEKIRGNDDHDDDDDGGDDDPLLLARLLGRSGEARVSLGDVDGGIDDFLEGVTLLNDLGVVGSDDGTTTGAAAAATATTVAADDRFEVLADLYMYLGQTGEGEEALEWYKKGIGCLESFLRSQEASSNTNANGEDNDDIRLINDIRQKLCTAHCTISELYLTDLCDHPDAESHCETHLSHALQYDTDASLPDALQTCANLRLSQSRHSDATTAMLSAWERMKPGCEALARLVGLGPDGIPSPELSAAVATDENGLAASLPGFEFRCQSAKLLLECGALQSSETTEGATLKNRCCDAAVSILGSLLAENDEVAEIWYLVGCAFVGFEPKNVDMARFHWERALEMLEAVREAVVMTREEEEEDDDDDVEMGEEEDDLEGIDEKIKNVRDKLKEIEDEEAATEVVEES